MIKIDGRKWFNDASIFQEESWNNKLTDPAYTYIYIYIRLATKNKSIPIEKGGE